MTDTFYDAASFDGRMSFSGVCRRAARFFAGSVAMGLGAVAAVGLSVVGVTLAAAWMVNATLATNPQLAVKASAGPGTLALVAHDTLLAGAPSRAREYASKMPPRPLDISAEIARDRGSVQVARLEPIIPMPQRRPRERAGIVPLPRPNPAPQEIARPPVVEPALQIEKTQVAKNQAAKTQVAKVAEPAPQFAKEVVKEIAKHPPQQVAIAVPPPPSAAEKRAAPQREAHNKSIGPIDPDSRTAVYDISARAVYMPNGEKLEAHSGLYDKLDDPRYVNVKMRGPTPPNVYELTLREQLFHGVRAIRLNPVDEGKMYGRAGMLAHTYMLGPNGDSNGCVSFRDYNKFLQAFLRGEVDRLVVVPEGGTKLALTTRSRRGHVDRYASNSAPFADRNANSW
jgi:hypothetical protein